MPTYSIKDFPHKSDEINEALDSGEEVTITRNGKTWFKLGPKPRAGEKVNSPLHRLTERFTDLPDLGLEDFQAVKTIWGPHDPCTDQDSTGRAQ
ncbi:MAG: hypothetical protein OXC95_11855 [Dehalococcoidia bacterium]|nr:hypothetical protein [Dehalococcoidia bacterium]